MGAALLELAAGALLVACAVLAGRQALSAARSVRRTPTLVFGVLSPTLALAGLALIADAMVRLLIN